MKKDIIISKEFMEKLREKARIYLENQMKSYLQKVVLQELGEITEDYLHKFVNKKIGEGEIVFYLREGLKEAIENYLEKVSIKELIHIFNEQKIEKLVEGTIERKYYNFLFEKLNIL